MKIYLKFLGLFALCFSILQCSKNIKPTYPLQLFSLNIQSLKAINLSEDMNEVSTKEDEILLLTFLIDNKDSTLQIIEDWHFENTFRSRAETFDISKTIDLKTLSLKHKKLLFMLVELDNENSVNAVNSVLKQTILKESSLDSLKNIDWDKLIGHDDFLDFQILDLNKITSSSPTSLKFSGLQMFDRFEYSLNITFKARNDTLN